VAVDVLRNHIKVAADQRRHIVLLPSDHLLDQSIHPCQLVQKFVTPHRVTIGKIDIDDAYVPDDDLEKSRMDVGIVSNESRGDRPYWVSRQGRNSVIGLLSYRYTLKAERLENLGWELRPLQFLQQQHIGFMDCQPCRDMGQARANRI
jgi:hypothetical protein